MLFARNPYKIHSHQYSVQEISLGKYKFMKPTSSKYLLFTNVELYWGGEV